MGVGEFHAKFAASTYSKENSIHFGIGFKMRHQEKEKSIILQTLTVAT